MTKIFLYLCAYRRKLTYKLAIYTVVNLHTLKRNELYRILKCQPVYG